MNYGTGYGTGIDPLTGLPYPNVGAGYGVPPGGPMVGGYGPSVTTTEEVTSVDPITGASVTTSTTV